MIISVPSEITQVERRAVTDSAYRAKAAEVHLVEQAMMAAIGAGLPVTKPVGNLVVDIGGGTTDVALISMSGIVYSRSLRIAGNHMDEAIVNYVKRKYNLLIGERMAEKIKIEVGSAAPLEKPVTMEIKGRSLIEGIPKTITVDDNAIREALNESVAAIVGAIRVALERTPPELSADISDRGLVLAGGGALLKNLDKRIREETSLPVCIADDPVCSVVLGTRLPTLLRRSLSQDAAQCHYAKPTPTARLFLEIRWRNCVCHKPMPSFVVESVRSDNLSKIINSSCGRKNGTRIVERDVSPRTESKSVVFAIEKVRANNHPTVVDPQCLGGCCTWKPEVLTFRDLAPEAFVVSQAYDLSSTVDASTKHVNVISWDVKRLVVAPPRCETFGAINGSRAAHHNVAIVDSSPECCAVVTIAKSYEPCTRVEKTEYRVFARVPDNES